MTFRSYLKSVYDSMSVNDKLSWKTFGEITKHGVHLQEGNPFGQRLPAGPNFSLWI